MDLVERWGCTDDEPDIVSARWRIPRVSRFQEHEDHSEEMTKSEIPLCCTDRRELQWWLIAAKGRDRTRSIVDIDPSSHSFDNAGK